MEDTLVPIGKAAEMLGVAVKTLRRWDESGKLRAIRRSPGGDRFYRKSDLDFFPNDLFQTAFEWASAEVDSLPEIPRRNYCENSGVFQARLSRLQEKLNLMPEPEDIFPLVMVVAGEIGGNSFDHNIGQWPDISGIFFAYHADKREIVLADRGVGILSTLKTARPDLITDESALRVAFTEFVSGRRQAEGQEPRGNGLKFVKDVVSDSLISLRFQTGNAEVEITHDSSELKIRPAIHYLRGCIAYIKY